MSSPSDSAPESPGEADPASVPLPSTSPTTGRGGPHTRNTVVLLVSAAPYSLLIAGITLPVGAFLVWMFHVGETGSSLAAGIILCALLVGAHRVLLAALRRADLPHPEATTTLLTTLVVLVFTQTTLLLFVFGAGRS